MSGTPIPRSFIDATLAEMKAEQLEELREQLAVHCPPAPDWYQPVPPGMENRVEHRHGSWPWFYADMVLRNRS